MYTITKEFSEWLSHKSSESVHVIMILLLHADETGLINLTGYGLRQMVKLSPLKIERIIRELIDDGLVMETGFRLSFTGVPQGVTAQFATTDSWGTSQRPIYQPNDMAYVGSLCDNYDPVAEYKADLEAEWERGEEYLRQHPEAER